MNLNKYFKLIPCRKKKCRKIQLAVSGIVVFSLVTVYLKPAVYMMNFLGIENINGCPLFTFTGIPCPTCGMGRSFSCITDFRITESFYYNPSALFLLLTGGFIIGAVLFYSFKNKSIRLTTETKKFWYLPAALIIIVWVLNILLGHHH